MPSTFSTLSCTFSIFIILKRNHILTWNRSFLILGFEPNPPIAVSFSYGGKFFRVLFRPRPQLRGRADSDRHRRLRNNNNNSFFIVITEGRVCQPTAASVERSFCQSQSFRYQFHQHLTHAFFVRKCFFAKNITREKHFCCLAPKVCTKNARIKRWWNWRQVSIAAFLCESVFAAFP